MLGEGGSFAKIWVRLVSLGEGWDFQIFWVSLMLLGEVHFPWVRVIPLCTLCVIRCMIIMCDHSDGMVVIRDQIIIDDNGMLLSVFDVDL